MSDLAVHGNFAELSDHSVSSIVNTADLRLFQRA